MRSFAARIPRWFEVWRKTNSSTTPVSAETMIIPSHERAGNGAKSRSKARLIAALKAPMRPC
jgi:hypothetical protein